MTVKIVTDSTCDVPLPVANGLGMTVIPLNVHFGEEVYRDGVDISADAFYEKLVKGPVHPFTSQPSAGVFAQTYETLAKDGSEILSVHISSKLSGTYNSAVLGRQAVKTPTRIELVDSGCVSMGLGLLVIALNEKARAGADMERLLELTNELLKRLETYSVADTLEYLQKGGRVSRLRAFFGTLLKIKPVLQVTDGEVHLKERVRSRAQGVERLVGLVQQAGKIQDLSVMYTTSLQDAHALAERLDPYFPKEKARIYQHGATLGVHLGPGALGVTFIKAGGG